MAVWVGVVARGDMAARGGVVARGGVGALGGVAARGGVTAWGGVGALEVLLLGEEWAPLVASTRGAHSTPSADMLAESHPPHLPRH
jgi:hypothetical protein